MKSNDFFNLKLLNRYYVKRKEKEIKDLEALALKLSQNIEEEERKRQGYELNLEKTVYKYNELKSLYNNLINMVLSRGIILDIENVNFNIKEWDNLYIYKKSGKYFIKDKNNIDYESLDKDTSELFEEIFDKGYNYSIVVIRVTKRLIKIQIRFYKKEE
ncbi:hypothetical protein HMPREF1982_01340 [Clostridiales bacterium oral taxon 876 str. F0540]|nr:hypothetical protein HMPREF1982_01340 [Clostridiales bacterium oral taxon 876 str. F0540]